ncbi:DnaJ domain-containing protein [Candidatus Sumerlaeota bacterium]|nr:DnaJ domain-containing protein [Candidatus Sumerlaeota bacterium]
MAGERDPYAVLNIHKGATEQEVKQAYVDLVKRYDPETHTEQFMVIQEAYKKLKDVKRRAKEDILIFNYIKGELLFNEEEKNVSTIESLNHEIRVLETRLRDNSSDQETRKNLILAYMQRSWHSVKKKRWAEAIEDWQRVLNFDPTHNRAKNNLIYSYIILGYSYACHGLISEAVDLWEKSLRMNPDNLAIIQNLAIGAEKIGNAVLAQKYWAECLRRWKTMLDQDQGNEYIKNMIIEVHKHLGGMALQQPEIKQTKENAIGEYREILKINPNDFDAQYQIASTLMEEQKWDEAVQELRKLEQYHPRNVEVLNLLGWALLNSGQVDNAFTVWKKSLAFDPENPTTKDNLVRAHLSLGKKLRESGLYTPALVHFKALLKYLPNSAEVHFEIGSTYSMKGDIHSAMREFNTTLQLDPKNKLARKAISVIKLRR